MASRGLWLACLALAVIALPILADRLALLPLHVAAQPERGMERARTPQAWLAGRALYLDPAGPVLNNYPPLSFTVVAFLGRLTGDLIVAGRILSIVSLLVVATFSGVIACMLGGARAAGWFTGLLLLTTFLVGYTDYVAMNDPQMLALALSTLGLWTLVRWWESTAGARDGDGADAAGGTHQAQHDRTPDRDLIAVWLESPRRGVALAMAGAIATALALGLIHLAWGPRRARRACWPDDNGRRCTSRRTSCAECRCWRCRWPASSPGAGLLSRRGPDRLLLIYAVMALATALFTGGGAGVYYNCFFDLVIASCTLSGIIVCRAMQAVGARYPQARFLPLALVLGVATLAIKPLLTARWNLQGGDAAALAALTAADVSRIRDSAGPVACETTALCYWAGKGFELDYFNARQAMLTGRSGEDNVLSLIRSQKFSLIQLQDRLPGARLSPPVPGEMAVLDSNYVEVHHSGTGIYLVPRRSAAVAPSP